MQLTFRALEEAEPGERWAGEFRRCWSAYSEWFIREGDSARPDLDRCRQMLSLHMPELVPIWERLVELSGEGEQVARMLSLYRPTPYLSGCSQAIWSGPPPLLVRNYDYHPHACEGTLWKTEWAGTRVLAMSDCLWGVLDGVNEHGLSVALSFGGRRAVGDGFGIPLVLRYVLQTCTNAADAERVLKRIPSHMSYNVSVLDRKGTYFVAYLSPDRRATVLPLKAATNHQHEVEWTRHDALTHSAERGALLEERVADPKIDRETFVDGFLRPPLYSQKYARGFGTLYTASYDAGASSVELRWPGHRWEQSLDAFTEQEFQARFHNVY